LAVAKDAGLDEATIALLDADRRSGFSAAHAAALDLADALMTQPGGVGDELVTELHRHFSREQIIELTLDVMKWNTQKISVALGTDAPLRPDRLAELDFDEEGRPVIT
jgi:hypothetical protein